MYRWSLLLIVCLWALSSCNDDLPSSEIKQRWGIELADNDQQAVLPRQSSYESLRVKVTGQTNSDEVVLISTTDDWLQLETDTLPSDGIVSVATQTNEGNTRRYASLTFRSTDNPLHTDTLELTQLSSADNASNSDPMETLYIGYGYDIYKNANSQKSVHTLEPILDYDYIKQYFTASDTYEPIHDCQISRTEINYCAALTLSQYSTELTSASTGSSGILGCLYDCKETLQLSPQTETTAQNYGYGEMVKTCYSRVLDRGAIEDLQRNKRLQNCFTSGFSRAYNKVKTLSGDARKQAIQDLLAKYGTHVITQADMGGKIVYRFTMNKSDRADNEAELKQEIDYTLGTITQSDRNTEYQQTVSSSKSADGAIAIYGGTDEAKAKLRADVQQLSAGGQLPPNDITDWLASVVYTGYIQNSPTLDIVNFELLPVWDLVEDDLRVDFMNATLDMISRSDCKLPDGMLSATLYEIDATRSDLVNFDQNTNSSLCRTLYLKTGNTTEPVVEVCQEYVPKIRSDKRVTIAYPIYKNRIRLTQGIFLGDDEHAAATVAFGGSTAYVAPLTLSNGEKKVKKLYYVNGTLYANSPAFTCYNEDTKSRQVRDDVLSLRDIHTHKLYRHPIVKIGNTFWTRSNIDHTMDFTDDVNDRTASSQEIIENDVLFSRIQYEVGFWFRTYNSWTYGYSPLTSLDGKPNTKWYLPTPTQLSELNAYLGSNPKALFKGQSSGFDAQFSGYVGYYDIQAGKNFSDYRKIQRYNGEICALASHSPDNNQAPNLLLLRTDYSLKTLDDGTIGNDWRKNYYPIRLCRGAYYSFHDLETLKSKEK